MLSGRSWLMGEIVSSRGLSAGPRERQRPGQVLTLRADVDDGDPVKAAGPWSQYAGGDREP